MSSSSSDRTDLDEEVTRAIDNMYTEEGGYKKTIQALEHDSEYDHERIREIAQSPEVSKTPHYKKQFQRLLESSKKKYSTTR